MAILKLPTGHIEGSDNYASNLQRQRHSGCHQRLEPAGPVQRYQRISQDPRQPELRLDRTEPQRRQG